MTEKRPLLESKNAGLIQELLRQAKLIYKLMGDKRVNFLLKLLPVASLVYLVSPVDLVPGIIPIER